MSKNGKDQYKETRTTYNEKICPRRKDGKIKITLPKI